MKRVLGAVVLLAVLAAILFATCDRDDSVPDLSSRTAAAPPTADAPTKRARSAQDAADITSTDETSADSATTDETSPAAPSEAEVSFENYKGRVAAPKHVLRGRVVGTTGFPVGGLIVKLNSTWLPQDVIDNFLGWPPEATSSVKTGVDGTFELPYWEGGPRQLHVLDSNEKVLCILRDVGDDRFHEIVIQRNADVVVRTVAAEDGKLVTVLHVTIFSMNLYDFGNTYDEVLGEQASDECAVSKGVHRFPRVPAGRALLEIDVDDRAPVREWITVAESGEQTIDVPLVVGRTLSGRVVDAETGAGVPNAGVCAGYYGYLGTRTDAQGRFALEHVPLEPRRFETFHASADGYAETSFLADDTDGAEHVVKISRFATVKVRCVDATGAPLEQVVVTVSSDYDASPAGGMRSTMTSRSGELTGADGRSDLRDLAPGTEGLDLRVRFFLEGVLVLEKSYEPLRSGETRDLGDVVVSPAHSIAGTVTDSDGKPAAGVIVVAAKFDPDDAEHGAIGTAVIAQGGRRAETGPDGRFTLMGLSAGLWDLYATTDDVAPGRLVLGVDPRVGSVEIRLPRIVAVEGRVVDAMGTPLEGVAVTATREAFGLRMMVSCTTSAEGRFSVPGFAADAPETEISVSRKDGSEPQSFKARPGVPTTELRLR